MSMSFQKEILLHSDIVALTGKTRHSAQARYLNHLGIEHKTRPDGSLLVLSDCVRQSMGLGDGRATTERKKPSVRTSGLVSIRNRRVS